MDMKINAKPVAKPEEGTSPKKEPDKLQKLFWENRYVLLSFGGAIVVYILICIAYRMIPFGDVTILRMDLYHQYGPLLAELYDRITHGGSLAYSWQTGGGGNFLGNLFNYLSSPISILVILLLGHKNMPVAIGVIIMLKAAPTTSRSLPSSGSTTPSPRASASCMPSPATSSPTTGTSCGWTA